MTVDTDMSRSAAIETQIATEDSRRDARLATGFASAGFLIGLSFTVPSGDAIDIAYHGFGLVILIITLGALRQWVPDGDGPAALPSGDRARYRR